MLNEPRVIEIEGYGTVKVRDPTKGDRIQAKQEAMESPVWDSLSLEEQELDVLYRTMIMCVVEPKITKEMYLEGKESAIRDIIDSVLLDYSQRLREISDKRKRTMKGFLEAMKE